MGQPSWPDGSPVEGVFISKVQKGVSPTFSLELDMHSLQAGDNPAPPEVLEELCKFFPELTPGVLDVSSDDALDLLRCVAFANLMMAQFPYEGEIVDDLEVTLACAFFRDATMNSEIRKWAEKSPYDTARHTEVMMAIAKEITAMQSHAKD